MIFDTGGITVGIMNMVVSLTILLLIVLRILIFLNGCNYQKGKECTRSFSFCISNTMIPKPALWRGICLAIATYQGKRSMSRNKKEAESVKTNTQVGLGKPLGTISHAREARERLIP